MHIWKGHEQRIGRHPQEHTTVFLVHCQLGCPGFLNSTGRLGPKGARKCNVTPAFSGVPKQRGTKSEVKTSATGHHDAPRGPEYLKAWVSSTATRQNSCTARALRLRLPLGKILP